MIKNKNSLSKMRKKLLNNPGAGELEFDSICDILDKHFNGLKPQRQKIIIYSSSAVGRPAIFNKLYHQDPNQLFFLDFYFSKVKVCVEIDGINHVAHKQKEWDRWRTEALSKHGISVIRYAVDDILYAPHIIAEEFLQYLMYNTKFFINKQIDGFFENDIKVIKGKICKLFNIDDSYVYKR